MPCTPPTIVVANVTLSTNNFENAQPLISSIGSDLGDPTADEFEGYIANGSNDRNVTGIQQTLPKQTELPTPIPLPAKESIVTPPPVIVSGPLNCTIWDGIDYDVKMSANFVLRDFTIGQTSGNNSIKGPMFPHQLTDYQETGYPHYSMQTRFCNLQGLAQKVLEPLWLKFGPFRINSGIRNENSVKAPAVSQHVTGEAADVVFTGWSYEVYWKNAQWIKDNIAYDQFIFEHSSKSPTVWLHLSYKQSGGRSVGNPNKVMTMYRGHYDSGLKKYY